MWLWTTLAWGGPQSLVVVGGDVVAAPDTVAPDGTVGWVAVLQDCLDERSPAGWDVVRQPIEATPGETAAGVQRLAPSLVVLGVGRTLGGDVPLGPFKQDMKELFKSLQEPRNPRILVLGVVPPTAAAAVPDAQDQSALDARAAQWNEVLADVAQKSGAEHIDLLAGWPTTPDARAGLTESVWQLSDQGHARVAAAVCDVVVPPPERKKRRP